MNHTNSKVEPYYLYGYQNNTNNSQTLNIIEFKLIFKRLIINSLTHIKSRRLSLVIIYIFTKRKL